MIVIPTYNGYKYLEGLLSDLKEFGKKNSRICIVDNQSTDSEHLNFLKDLKFNGYRVMYNKRPTYELGAFDYAVKNGQFLDSHYALLQDSIRLKENVFNMVSPHLDDDTVYTLASFTSGLYDNHNDHTYLLVNYGTTSYSKGLFGSMMFITHDAFEKACRDWKLPTNKIESMGSERGIAVALDKNNIKIKGLEQYDPDLSGDYKNFKKIYGKRQ